MICKDLTLEHDFGEKDVESHRLFNSISTVANLGCAFRVTCGNSLYINNPLNQVQAKFDIPHCKGKGSLKSYDQGKKSIFFLQKIQNTRLGSISYQQSFLCELFELCLVQFLKNVWEKMLK